MKSGFITETVYMESRGSFRSFLCSDEDANDTREEEESPDSECSVDKEELVLELVGCKR